METRDGILRFLRNSAAVLAALVGALVVVTCFDTLVTLGRVCFDPDWLVPATLDIATKAVTNTSRVATTVLAMLISGMAIALPLAANNYTPRLITLFTRDPVNRGVFGLLLGFGALAMWAAWAIRESFVPRLTMVVTFCLFLMSVSVIVPYLFYLFGFLNPNSVIQRLRRDAEQKLRRARAAGDDPARLLALGREVFEQVDSIANIALRTLERRDRQAFIAAVHSLRALAVHYANSKHLLPPAWHAMDVGLAGGLAVRARAEVQDRRVTAELYMAQVLLGLFESTAEKMRDAVDDVAFNVYLIGAESIRRGDHAALDVWCSLFNSALRWGVNRNDIRMLYNVLPHYCALAADADAISRERAAGIALRIVEYVQMAAARGGALTFAAEIAAHELGCLLDSLRTRGGGMLPLVRAMEGLPVRTADGRPLLGVLKARLTAAAQIDPACKSEAARRLAAPFAELDQPTVQRIADDLTGETPLLYSEITARLANMDWLPPEARERVRQALAALRAKP